MVPATLPSIEAMQALRRTWAVGGELVGFVPTMGALHEGHMSLVRAAKAKTRRVVVSIFVNPIQFGPQEDLARYPRTLDADLALLALAGADAVFLPTPELMYPPGFQTKIHNPEWSKMLCGKTRPDHFEGVLTVVAKLFAIVQPQVAIFGKKDYQQWRMIERMAKDLNMGVDVEGLPIVREADGLAMSSRNRYLDESSREVAQQIPLALEAGRQAYRESDGDPGAAREACQAWLEKHPKIHMEYVEVRRGSELTATAQRGDRDAVLLIAARVGSTRLIDNVELASTEAIMGRQP